MSEPSFDTWVAKARAVPLQDVLRRHSNIKLSGRGGNLVGPCPQCGGTDRFAVSLRKRQFNCRGCGGKGTGAIDLETFLDSGADFQEVVTRLTGKPSPAKKKNGKAPDEGAPALVGEFIYEDENGEPLFRVQRFDRRNVDASPLTGEDGKTEKFFVQSRPDPNLPGRWLKGIEGVRRVLYRLPELLEDLALDREIIIVEGERKVDLLRSWSVPATCSPMGAKNWKDEYAAPLRGAKITVLPDNDALGRVYLNTVAASLVKVSATVRVLELPGLGPKEDVIEWAARGGTAEQLHALIECEARPWKPSNGDGPQHFPTNVGTETILPPPPDRGGLTIAAWLEKKLPPRDYLLGGVMCTTSRWFVFGETGIGKTLLGMDMGGAIAAAMTFLKWPGQRRARVIYLDGELPIETFKERMELIAARYGADLEFYGYNREALGDDGMPPLNTEAGQKWLWREIEAIRPDLIIFDSIMSLLVGSMSEESTWMPMRPFVRELSRRHIAQVWLHHANDSGKSFGDKTREWEMDTVVFLSRPIGEDGEPDDSAIRLEFRKARLRTPANAEQFLPLIVRLGDDWQVETAPKKATAGNRETALKIVHAEILKAYDRLADGVEKSEGLDFKLVRKVPVAAITADLKSRGFLDTDDKGAVTHTARTTLWKAKAELLKTVKLVEKEGLIWRP